MGLYGTKCFHFSLKPAKVVSSWNFSQELIKGAYITAFPKP